MKSHERGDGARHAGAILVSGLCRRVTRGRTKPISTGRPITPAGAIRESRANPGAAPVWITTGPDGNLWFTEASANAIGAKRIL